MMFSDHSHRLFDSRFELRGIFERVLLREARHAGLAPHSLRHVICVRLYHSLVGARKGIRSRQELQILFSPTLAGARSGIALGSPSSKVVQISSKSYYGIMLADLPACAESVASVLAGVRAARAAAHAASGLAWMRGFG